MFCSHCGSKVSDKAKYCPQCGKELVAAKRKREALLKQTESDPVKEKPKPSGNSVSDAPNLVLSDSYIVVSVLLGISILLMFANWISFPMLGTAAQTASSYLGISTGFSSEYNIPGLAMAFTNLAGTVTSYSDSYVNLLAGPLIFLSIVALVWFGILVALVISLVKTIKEKSILNSLPLSTFVALLIFVGVVLIGVFLLDSSIASINQYTGMASSLLGSYVSTTIWLWLPGIVSVIGILYIKFGQK